VGHLAGGFEAWKKGAKKPMLYIELLLMLLQTQ
jgi:hypothetical protein